jgi:hypothetical protein
MNDDDVTRLRDRRSAVDSTDGATMKAVDATRPAEEPPEDSRTQSHGYRNETTEDPSRRDGREVASAGGPLKNGQTFGMRYQSSDCSALAGWARTSQTHADIRALQPHRQSPTRTRKGMLRRPRPGQFFLTAGPSTDFRYERVFLRLASERQIGSVRLGETHAL